MASFLGPLKAYATIRLLENLAGCVALDLLTPAEADALLAAERERIWA